MVRTRDALTSLLQNESRMSACISLLTHIGAESSIRPLRITELADFSRVEYSSLLSAPMPILVWHLCIPSSNPKGIFLPSILPSSCFSRRLVFALAVTFGHVQKWFFFFTFSLFSIFRLTRLHLSLSAPCLRQRWQNSPKTTNGRPFTRGGEKKKAFFFFFFSGVRSSGGQRQNAKSFSV